MVCHLDHIHCDNQEIEPQMREIAGIEYFNGHSAITAGLEFEPVTLSISISSEF